MLQKTAPATIRISGYPVILDMVHFILPVLDGLAHRGLVCSTRMLLSAFGQRQAFDFRILDRVCFDNMGFIHPHTVAVSLVAIHSAVGRGTAEGVPSGASDKILRYIAGAPLRSFVNVRDALWGFLGLSVDEIEIGYRQEYE